MISEEKRIKIEKCFVGHIIADPSILDSSLIVQIDRNMFIDAEVKEIYDAIKAILPCQNSNDVLFKIHEKYSGAFGKLAAELLTCRFNFTFESCYRWIIEASNKKCILAKLSDTYAAIASNVNNMSSEDILLEINNLIHVNMKDHSLNNTLIYRNVVADYTEELEKKIANFLNGIIPGTPTGIKELDDMIYGWLPGSYSVIGARTSSGKTTLALNFADAALKAEKKVLFFTNEMKGTQLVAKHLSKRAKIKGPLLHLGDLKEDEINRIIASASEISKLPFFINQKSGRSFSQFEHEVKMNKRKNNIDLVIIDYIQQMYPDDGSRYGSRLQELTHISAGIQRLANELNIAIICLAQLNRQADSSNEPPSISQIKDCGAIEQDADNVLLIHIDKKVPPNGNGEIPAQLIVGKSRYGKTGFCPVMVNFAFNSFR